MRRVCHWAGTLAGDRMAGATHPLADALGLLTCKPVKRGCDNRDNHSHGVHAVSLADEAAP